MLQMLFVSIMPAKSCKLPYDVHSSGRFNPQVYYFEFQVCFIKLICVELKNEARLRAFHDPDAKSKRKECLILLEKTPASGEGIGELNPVVSKYVQIWRGFLCPKRLLELTKSQTNILIQGLREEVLSEQNFWKRLRWSESFLATFKVSSLKDLQSFLTKCANFLQLTLQEKTLW